MLDLNKDLFSIGATLFSAIATVPYIWSIFKGQTKPSGASWWTWTLLTMVTVVSSRVAGAPWQVIILPLWLCFSQLVIALLSVKRGDNNWDLINKICVASALLGIGLWLITGQPVIALLISIAADLLASIPNFRHAFRNPEQENRTGWTLGWLAAVLEMFTISVWSVAEAGWAIYFLLNMTITLVLVYRLVRNPRR